MGIDFKFQTDSASYELQNDIYNVQINSKESQKH